MKYVANLLALTLAFSAGLFAARASEPARAADPSPQATAIDLDAVAPGEFAAPNPALPNLRSKPLVKIDSTVFSYQEGTAPKHVHLTTTEVQLILAGTGTEWVGDKQVAIRPHTFVIVPPNTPHGGFTGGPFRFLTVKTPPQDPTDYHSVP
ncbi:MAG: cupin domain-containing protein [Candidatus Eremiobacteraeota bacterium]|nr:cupin domain-containing protein [Candidatus Eremiobacteraeota bacterium]